MAYREGIFFMLGCKTKPSDHKWNIALLTLCSIKQYQIASSNTDLLYFASDLLVMPLPQKVKLAGPTLIFIIHGCVYIVEWIRMTR